MEYAIRNSDKTKKTIWGILLMALCLFVTCRKPEIGNNHEGGDNDTITIIEDSIVDPQITEDTIVNPQINEDTIVNPQIDITTIPPFEIISNEATCGAKLTMSGSCNFKELGICWGTAAEPTVSDSVRKTENYTDLFICTLTGLTPATEYHVRAYILTDTEYIYGLDEQFTTLEAPIIVPIGAINSLFTINESGDQVYFSQGNLQYQASTNTFQFANKQLEYLGTLNCGISPTYDGWIDLFGWGTSGWDCGTPSYYHPWDYALTGPYGPTGYDLTGGYANSDWGVYNSIINGGNEAGLWRTLTQPEWETLLMTRQTPSGIRYVKATIGNTTGLLIIPDDWDADTYNFTSANLYESYFSDNLITEEDWNNILEPAGVVFLPAAGVRYNRSVCEMGNEGNYWSASHQSSYGYALLFHDYYIYTIDYYNAFFGKSVRLVQDARNQIRLNQ